MNPKLTISIDSNNRATAVAEGIVSVGAKVDVVVRGLPSDIPSWGEDDGFVGPAFRFRVVDAGGCDLARYPLVETDFWSATTTSGEYTAATETEFDTDALRRIFEGVMFDDKLEFGIIVDSAVDYAEYGVGRLKIRQWAVALTEDPTVLPDWRETLEALNTDLNAVKENVAAAATSATAAEAASAEATASAAAAATSATAAEAAQNAAEAASAEATASAAAAATSATVAEASAVAAEKSAQDAAEVVDTKLAVHTSDHANPHAVTAAQVDAYTKAEVADTYREKTDLNVYDGTARGKHLFFEFEDGTRLQLKAWDDTTSGGNTDVCYGRIADESSLLDGKRMRVYWMKDEYGDLDEEDQLNANVDLCAEGDYAFSTPIGIGVLIPSTKTVTFTNGTRGKFVVTTAADTLAKTSEVATAKQEAIDKAKSSAAEVQANLDTHTGDTDIHITADERTIWDCVKVFDSTAQAYVPLFTTTDKTEFGTGLYIKPNLQASLYWDRGSLYAEYMFATKRLSVGYEDSSYPMSVLEYDSLAIRNDWIVLGTDVKSSTGWAYLYTRQRSYISLGSEDEVEGNASYITSGSGKTTFALKDGTKGSVLTPDGTAVVTEGTLKTKAPVTSVNNKTGEVALTADDIGALPATSENGVSYVGNELSFSNIVAVNNWLYANKITSAGGSISFYEGEQNASALKPDGSAVLTKSLADTYYATQTALDALAATVGEANALLESVA